MKNLIIIGNGFDKAHNLKTSYNEFIENLFNEKYFKDKDSYTDVLESCLPTINTFEKIINHFQGFDAAKRYAKGKNCPFHFSPRSANVKFNSRFIELLIYDMAEYKWCDIEYKYFQELKRYNNSEYNPKILNDDFDIVKKHLVNYLKEEEKNAAKIDSYEYFFKLFTNSPETLILNFNYTRTLENLYKDVVKCQIIHIHGELENEENPIIFGYAADIGETSQLLSQNDQEFLKNIKKYSYKRTNNERNLNLFLDSIDRLDSLRIFILGHSCGLSDNLILNTIFNHRTIGSINMLYHENYKNYFDVQVNIDRIMNSNTGFSKLATFPHSHRMPQWNDTQNQMSDFFNYINPYQNK